MLYRLIFDTMVIFINMISLFMDLKAYKLDQIKVLYTRIPFGLKENMDFVALVKEAKKSCVILYASVTVFSLILSLYFDSVVIMIVDVLILTLVRPFFLQKDIDKARAFKNKYVKKEDKIKVVDLELIEKREDFLVKKSLYLFIIAIYLASIFMGLYLDKVLPDFLWIFLGLVFACSDIFVDRMISSRLVKVYTRDSSTNIRLNEEIGKNQSKIIYRKSLVNALLFLIFVLISVKNPYSASGFIIYFVFLMVNIVYSFYGFDKLKNHPDLKNQDINLLEDDVEYYTAWGYKNPNDKRLFVDKVYGMGNELNIGRLSGKIYYITTIILLLALLIFVSYITSTPTKYTYQVEKDKIEISSNMFYKDTIDRADIEEISLLDNLPKGRMIRIAGSALEKTSTGSYKIENYGKVRLYIYNDTDKVLSIKTKDKNFLVNDTTEQKTKMLYQKLLNFINKEKK